MPWAFNAWREHAIATRRPPRSAAHAVRQPLPPARIFEAPALLGPMALQARISPDGQSVAYLRMGDDDRHRVDLWLFERRTGRSRLLIDARQASGGRPESAAGAARRERQRTASVHGISEMHWSPDSRCLLLLAGDALLLATWQAQGPARLKTLLPAGGELLDPHWSPLGTYVAFVRDQNLHVLSVKTGRVRRLTDDGGGTVHNAEAEFVAQEEMDRSRGHWWAPDESLIAFERFDEAAVPVQRRFDVQADGTDVVEQRYPVTGGPNVAVSLGLVAPTGGPVRWVSLGRDRDIYLARVDWLPDGRSLSYQRLSRDQKTLALRLVNVHTLRQRTLRTETSAHWIELHQDLHFLKQQPAFVWAADRDGRKHLALVGLDGREHHALTAGDWQVDALLAVDEAQGWVYLSGDQGLALEKHVWRVRLDGSTAWAPERISAADHWHEASFASDGGPAPLWIDFERSPTQPPRARLRDAQGRHLGWLEENRLNARHPYHRYLKHHGVPSFGTVPADDGTPLSYSLLKPPGFDPARRYPVVVDVYGGPGAQMVTRGWPMSFHQALAHRGFCVFMLDNRGSARRGRAFSDVLLGRFGDVEVRDQLAGLAWLKQQPGIDAARIGVMGGSYGGYMTLKLLTNAPAGSYAAGIAVSAATRYELYDTCYTERYLGTPQANPEGYRRTSVLPDLPRLKTPLLLVHGMADDNVLFTHCTEVMSALQAQGTPFRLMTYPGCKHSLAGPVVGPHAHQMFVDFFEETLSSSADGVKG